MLIPLKSTSPVLVMTSSMSVFTCNRFHVEQTNNEKITTFKGVRLFDTLVCRPLWTWGVGTKIYIQFWKFYMLVVLVYLQPFRRKSLLKCVSQPQIAKNCIKTFYSWSSRSFKIIEVDITKKLVASACIGLW